VKRWLLGLSAIVVVVILALALWRSSSLIVERTVIAELPLGINRLIPTDLDGDGEPEILAVCSHWYWKDISSFLFFHDHDRTDDPRVWFIRSPLGKPQATQLPYVCRWGWQLSSLPLQRSVLVEEGELLSLGFRKVWKASRLGWLKMTGEHLTFEPLLTVKGRVTHQLITGGEIAINAYRAHPNQNSHNRSAKICAPEIPNARPCKHQAIPSPAIAANSLPNAKAETCYHCSHLCLSLATQRHMAAH